LERLRGVTIYVPSLRSRVDDIELIVNQIISESSKPNLTMSYVCLGVLKKYDWPGNVRELEWIIKQMIAACPGEQISVYHLPQRIRTRLFQKQETGEAIPDASVARDYRLSQHGSLDEVIDEFLKQYLVDRYRALGSQASRAELARSLGIARNTLAQYLKRLNLDLGKDI
jgi:DNA-binding NtrC family response regulator